MNLRLKIAFFIGGLLLITVVIISSITIYSIQTKSKSDIEFFRGEEVRKARLRLQNVVDLAYGIVEDAHSTLGDRDSALEESLRLLSQIRFDGVEGYFWITDTRLPYPTMIMHAAKPDNNGKVMSDEKYNVVLGKEDKNLYQERVEQSLAEGNAFVDYFMVKPEEDKIYSKLSYSRLFEPLNWVISSGIYTDSIDEAVVRKREALESQLSNIVYTVIGVSLAILLLGLYIGWYFSNQLVSTILSVRDRLNQLSQGKIVDKIVRIRKDEIGDMTISLNRLVDSSSTYVLFAREISQGNLEMDFEKLSEDDVLGNELQSMRQNLKQIVDETNQVLHLSAEQGQLDTRINVFGKKGVWKDLSESINNLIVSLGKPIMEVNKIVNAMAQGDFSQRYVEESKGDIKMLVNNLNQALEQLNVLLAEIMVNANAVEESADEMLSSGEEMSRSTAEIASATGQMSSGAQSQVSKVDEVSNLIEIILGTSNDMKQKAMIINEAAMKGFEKSEKGGEMLGELVKNIHDISQYASVTHESIDVLTKRSGEISQVLSVISEIAAQTNLLALNAAIEAAQAGDSGRGFAVVAEEIRKLAEDSRKSAVKIEQLVSGVQKDTEEAAKVMDQMNLKVKSGTTVSSAASGIFKEITDTSTHTLQLCEEIVSSTEVQLKGIQNVVGITESVVVIAEQTAAGTEEVASSAIELASGMDNYKEKSIRLSSIATRLKEELANFKLR